MRKSEFTGMFFAIAFATGVFATHFNSAMAQKTDKSLTMTAQSPAQVRQETKIVAELESTLDAKSTKAGDEVTARVTKDVKQDGRVVVRKGDRLVGRVTDVKAAANAMSVSHLAVTFDHLVRGETSFQLNTIVSAVLSTPREERAQREKMLQSERMMTPPPMMSKGGPTTGGTRSNAEGRASSSSGGLLGGVTSTVNSTANVAGSVVGSVGSTADTATSAAGSVVGEAGSTINTATQAQISNTNSTMVATPLRMIQVGTEARADQQDSLSSAFSTRHGNLRLDSGTRLQFRVIAEGEKPAGKEKEKK